MISTITILGQASDLIPDYQGFRYVDVDSCEAFDENPFVSRIPVCYWDRGASRVVTDIPKGDIVCIFGRVESHEQIGLYRGKRVL